jgi:hypothetical protein
MTKAIIVAFHKYTPFGGEYYEPMLDFFLASMRKYKEEYDKLYLIDSNWEIDPPKLEGLNAEIIRVNPHLRYYDAYKEVLPQIKEDLVLFMDNDMIVYREGIFAETFRRLSVQRYFNDVVSIYDTIGEKTFLELNNKSKFCPYWFATSKDLLMEYRGCEWGPVPWGETLSELTEKMLADGILPYEWEEDKSNRLFDGTQDGEKSKDLGYYHIRAGSTPAYLLATRKYGNSDTYNEYLKNQPRNEYLRQLAWYSIMGGGAGGIADVLWDIKPDESFEREFLDYVEGFRKYHGL